MDQSQQEIEPDFCPGCHRARTQSSGRCRRLHKHQHHGLMATNDPDSLHPFSIKGYKYGIRKANDITPGWRYRAVSKHSHTSQNQKRSVSHTGTGWICLGFLPTIRRIRSMRPFLVRLGISTQIVTCKGANRETVLQKNELISF